VLQIFVLLAILGPLEPWRPTERWTNRMAVSSDMTYTLLNRLGLVPLAMFFALVPIVDGFDGWLRMQGFIPPNLEVWFPWLRAHPFAAFS
jgi:sterol desaturase/sphingolipid hydroxylase (fatty acid hydroxylase superfamily)